MEGRFVEEVTIIWKAGANKLYYSLRYKKNNEQFTYKDFSLHYLPFKLSHN